MTLQQHERAANHAQAEATLNGDSFAERCE